MPQIKLNPFDNNRVKNSKVYAMLNELGLWPTERRLRPNFLRGRVTATRLLDRALSPLVASSSIRKCDTAREIATAANSAFGAAYSIVPGDVPANGLIGSQFFLAGEEVEPTSFLSSGYNPANHSADGITSTEEGNQYYPQLAEAVVDLITAPCTIVMQGTFSADGICRLKSDNAVYFIIELSAFLTVQDNNATISRPELGLAAPTPPGEYRIAVTRTEGQLKASVNGGAVRTEAGDGLYPADGAVVLGVNGPGNVIGAFDILTDPVTVDADLQALSTIPAP